MKVTYKQDEVVMFNPVTVEVVLETQKELDDFKLFESGAPVGYLDSLGNRLKIGDRIHRNDAGVNIIDTSIETTEFRGMSGNLYKGSNFNWKFAVKEGEL